MKHEIDLLSYEDRLNRVTNYIFGHLDEDLNLNTLAEVACLSPFHWHRIYTAIRGETVAATVKRLRLARAATYLAQTTISVEDVARKSGYHDVQSFTRIFKSVYGLPPATYRREGSHTQFNPTRPSRIPTMYDVTIKSLPAMTAVTIEHRGPYIEIGRTYGQLFGWLAARQLIAPDLQMVAIYYDDVSVVPAEALRSRAGVVTDRVFPIEPPLERTEIIGGEYAVLRHKGPYADMKAAYDWLYGQWLAQSGREPADAPAIEIYLNNPQDTPPMELLTDICLPLK